MWNKLKNRLHDALLARTSKLITELVEDGQLDQAAKLAQRFIERNPDDWVAHRLILDLHYRRQQYAACLEHASTIDDRIPVDGEFLVSVCYSLYELKRFPEIFEMEKQHSKIFACNKDLIHVVGLALYSAGHFEDAIKHLESNTGPTYQASSDMEEVLYTLASAHFSVGHFEQCDAILNSIQHQETLGKRFGDLARRCYGKMHPPTGKEESKGIKGVRPL